MIIDKAIEFGKPVRIGVNWGSLDQDLLSSMMDENALSGSPLDATGVMREALVTSAIRSAQLAEALGLPGDRIILACKISNVQDLIAVYTELARRCDYPLHLGLTEAGMGSKGIVASTAALAVLLQQGIGDTIRISLTPEPNGDRTREVIVAQEILQTMGLRSFTPLVSACPGCGRTTSAYFQVLADEIQTLLACAGAGVARALSRRREHDGRRDGVRRQWSRRIENGEHRHQPARHRRGSRRARVRRRPEDGDAQGRCDRRGIPADRRRLRARDLRRRTARTASAAREANDRHQELVTALRICPRISGFSRGPAQSTLRCVVSEGEQAMGSSAPHALRKCHAFGRVNVWMPYVDSVRPIPECLTPDHGSRGLTRSQQFQ